MKAALLLHRQLFLDETAFVELVVWCVPKRVCGSAHDFEYRLALIADGRCVMRYDNEAGKGDHKHIGNLKVPYSVASLTQLLADFWADVESWQEEWRCGPSR